MKNKTILLGTILVAALLLSGAVIAKNNGHNNGNMYGQINPNKPDKHNDEGQAACETSEDCPEDMICKEGECIEIECETDEDCDEDEVCTEGFCAEDDNGDDDQGQNNGNGPNGPNGPNPNGPNGPNNNGPNDNNGQSNNEGTPYGRPFEDLWAKIQELEERIEELEQCACVVCTDNDGDSYAVEGGVCGPVDCDDTDPEVNPSATEICDGIDNDCSGQVDGMTQTCYTGPAETQDVGVCQAGAQTCEAGDWGACVGEVTPSTETCDGLDNDCDGDEDEGDPGSGMSCDTGQLGICAGGTTQCISGAIVCVPNEGPVPETCDGLDNDCDGTVDDGDLCPIGENCVDGQCVLT